MLMGILAGTLATSAIVAPGALLAESVPTAPAASPAVVRTVDPAALMPSGFCLRGHNSHGGCNGGGVFKGSSGRCLSGAADGLVGSTETIPETGVVGPVVGAGIGCAVGYLDD